LRQDFIRKKGKQRDTNINLKREIEKQRERVSAKRKNGCERDERLAVKLDLREFKFSVFQKIFETFSCCFFGVQKYRQGFDAQPVSGIKASYCQDILTDTK
jgi:hypothetical protein